MKTLLEFRAIKIGEPPPPSEPYRLLLLRINRYSFTLCNGSGY